MFKNKEGYTDPTAGAAMASIMKEYRQNQRRIYRKHSEIKARQRYTSSRSTLGTLKETRQRRSAMPASP